MVGHCQAFVFTTRSACRSGESPDPLIERLRRIQMPRPAWSNSKTSRMPSRTEMFSASRHFRSLCLSRQIPPVLFTPKRLAAIPAKSRVPNATSSLYLPDIHWHFDDKTNLPSPPVVARKIFRQALTRLAFVSSPVDEENSEGNVPPGPISKCSQAVALIFPLAEPIGNSLSPSSRRAEITLKSRTGGSTDNVNRRGLRKK